MYLQSAVETRIICPFSINIGTFPDAPPSTIAGFVPPAGLSCQVSIWNDQVIDVQLPLSVEYQVIDTPPNFKGNSAAGGTKPAIVEGGASVNVPMFIENGQMIIVSTADCKYMGKVSGDKSF